MNECIKAMPEGLVKEENYKVNASSRNELKTSMEDLIHHFKLSVNGFYLPLGETYVGIEAPKGEFGVFLVSNETNQAYRCKIRSPGFIHLQSIDYLAKNLLIADIVTIIGTLDIVFGEKVNCGTIFKGILILY